MRIVAALTAGIVLLIASPASAGEPSVPAPVVAWFAKDAGAVAADVLDNGAVGIDAGRPGGIFTVGAPVRLHYWNPAFVAGTSDQIVNARDEWVAALYRDGAVAGTIAATLSEAGVVAFSYADDDITAGKALLSRDGTGSLVHDVRMGGLVDVRPDAKSAGLADLRAAIRGAHSRAATDVTDSAEGGSGVAAREGESPIGFAVALVAAALVLWFAWRRKPSHA